jgi:hypothetical protein
MRCRVYAILRLVVVGVVLTPSSFAELIVSGSGVWRKPRCNAIHSSCVKRCVSETTGRLMASVVWDNIAVVAASRVVEIRQPFCGSGTREDLSRMY